MDSLPKEIRKLILSYCGDETKRLARVSCKEWFDIIDYRDFTLYLTKKSDWPQIVDRLATYSKPISLTFRKKIMQRLHDISEHLIRLTNLTDLNFDELDSEEDNLLVEWLKFTALPNLHSVKVDSYDYTIPYEALLSLPNLTKFHAFWREEGDNLDEIKAFQRWTNLQSCWITPNHNLEMDLFDSYNTKLTSLFLSTPAAPGKWFNQLGNIKDFSLQWKTQQLFSLKSLTALECLILNGLQVHDLNSTNLTFLELFSVEEKYMEQEATNLARLKKLILDFKSFDGDNQTNGLHYSFQWLTELTALEYLNIDRVEADGFAFVSSGLTRLQTEVQKPVELRHLARMGSLKELYFRSVDETLQDLSLLSMLTQLDTLDIRLRHCYTEINFISSMTNLTWLQLHGCSCSNISHLPNLLNLDLIYTNNTHYGGLEGLTKLQALMVVNHGNDEIDLDYSFVSNLTTLQCLVLCPKSKYDCKHFSALINLDSLHVYQVLSEEDYCYLSPLTKLTLLIIRSGPPSEKILCLPTSLQNLEVNFNASMAQESEYGSYDVITTKIIAPLLARLPNLYKYRLNPF